MLQQVWLPKQLILNSRRPICFFAFFILFAFPTIQAQIIYVDSSVAVSGNGSSWANAYRELRDAFNDLNINTAIKEVDIAKGTYLPAAGSNQDSSFCIFRDNIKIIGGYSSGGGSRDVNANKVNLTGINGGKPPSTYHVMIIAGVSTATDSIILDGFTIANGLAVSGVHSYYYNSQAIYGYTGSGLCLQGNSGNCKIAIRNCSFTANTGNTGAGIYSYSTGSLFINNCSFNSNDGYGSLDAGNNSYGAGLYNYQTTATINNCSFTNNYMNNSGTGIGVYNEQASITISNSTFSGSSGPADGGGITNINGASADISYCMFTNNSIEDISGYGYGGGIYNSASSINLYHSTFIRNSFSGDGVLYLTSSPVAKINEVSFIQNYAYGFNAIGHSAGITSISSNPVVSNCLFAMDTSEIGGAMYNGSGSSPAVSNCTFFKNLVESSASGGAGVRCADSSGGKYSNCIFWGDTVYIEYAPFGRYEFYSQNNGSNLLHPSPSVSYSIIQSPFPILNVLDSGNNSNDYPQFVDSANVAGADGLYGTPDDGLQLQVCSPGIDAGINSAIPTGVTKDLKDDDRIFNNTVDIGCYENLSPVVNGSTLIADSGDSVFKSIYGTEDILKDCQLIASIVPSGASPLSGGIKVKVMIDQAGNLFAQPYVKRYYDIEPSKNAGTATATVSLYFTQADFDAYNLVRGTYPSLPVNGADTANYKSNIVVHQFHGSNGQGSQVIIVPSNVIWNSTNSWWVVSFEVTGFSTFYLNTSPITLPVVLEYFKGQIQGDNTYLTWKVDCSNSSLLTLNLQKSSNGTAYSTLYSTNTSEQNCLQAFNYTDVVLPVTANYYRLQIIESTAKITYSNTLLFNYNRLTEIIVSPGLIHQGQMLNVTVPENDYAIVIYNSIGAMLKKEKLVQGVNSMTLAIVPGVYFYGITDKNQHIQKTGKIIVD